VCVELIFFDAPYNVLPNTPWEFQITAKWLMAIFRQISAASTENWATIVIMHKMADSAIVLDAMQQGGLTQMIPFAWVKDGHHSQTPQSSLTSVFEVGTVGYKPDRTKVKWGGATADPRGRRNVIEAKPVSSFFKAADGEPINICQKPPEIIQYFTNMHVPPGGHVLIIGFGSGAEILGALDCDVNVVGIDSDLRQFEAVKTVLVHKYERELKLQKELAKEFGNSQTVAGSPLNSSVGSGNPQDPHQVALAAEEVDDNEYQCMDCKQTIYSMDDRNKCAYGCGYVHTQCGIEFNRLWYCNESCNAQYAGRFGASRNVGWQDAETQDPLDIG
jgi:hypothetical protein